MSGDRFPDGVDMLTPTVLVVGNEGQGIRRGILEACDFKVRIPMSGPIASLNASVAGAILLYEVGRQRRGASAPSSR
jgi:23S rRNA (guanosine2251-2'-O)-methyltransferase